MLMNTELLPHQREAVEKLIGLRVGALYMEMGTGKTRTALELISRRIDAGKLDKVLWLCPCSVQKNLKDDIVKHCPDLLPYIEIHGIESLSSSVRLNEELRGFVSEGRVMLVVDESNLVKNHRALRTEHITALSNSCRYRLILNGTPISRNEADLFSQWYLLDWRILGYRSFYSFAANHLEYDAEILGRIRRVLNTDYLIEKVAPYSYQCLRSECFTLPEKHYEISTVNLSREQSEHYDEVCEIMLERLDEQEPSTVYRLFSAAQAIISGLRVDVSGEHMRSERFFQNAEDNPRIRCLLETLKPFSTEKVIIFCKYVHEIEDILTILPNSVGFYGGLSKRTRLANLEYFRGDVQYLVANKVCAGYGLNLQFCHNVVYYSNDWDWATRAQSEDRVCRLGQEHDIFVVDLEAVSTLDSRILRCLSRKESLSNKIKSELSAANSTKEARGSFRKWLRGELNDTKGEEEKT